MQEFLIHVMNQYGYFGIAMLILIENLFPPIPSELVLVFGGFMTTVTTMQPPWVIVAATVGSVAGAAALYWLGRLLDRSTLERIFSGKLGRILRVKPEDLLKAEDWFVRYEKRAVLICRCVPVVRSLISLPAGMTKMRQPLFYGLTTVGTLVWNTVLVYIGAAAGEAWEHYLRYIEWFSDAVLWVLIAVACGLVIWWFLWYKRKKTTRKGNDAEC